MIGPRPCAYVCAYDDHVLTSQSYDISISTSTRRMNLYVFLVLMLMSTQFSLAYTCAYAYAYAYTLVKTRLIGLRVRCTYNHGQKSWDTFAFLGCFSIHTGPTPPLTPQTMLDACIPNFFRFNFV